MWYNLKDYEIQEETMKYRWDKKYLYWGITAFLVIAASLLFYFGIFHMNSIRSFFGKIYKIVTPLVYGAIIAYIMNPIVKFMEKHVFFRIMKWRDIKITDKKKKVIRMICIIVTLILFLLAIYGLMAMLIPQLFSSITNIIDNFPRYVDTIQNWLSNVLKNNPELEAYTSDFFDTAGSRVETWMNQELMPQVNALVRNFSSGLYGLFTFLKNFLIGAMISIYMLYGKENFTARGKQFLYCLFKSETANNTIRDLQFVDNMFGVFVLGEIIDSVIIGLLCYIIMSVFNMPFTLLISVIVGVTNVIPFFGPYLGAVPSAFLILLISPIQCLYFVIFIFILQQFDGNFLKPKILGDTMGLSGFMVIVAILIGGGFFGIFGMFIGVPTCAIICTIIRNQIFKRLRKKNLPTEVDYYRDIDHLDKDSLRPVLVKKQSTSSSEAFQYKRTRKEPAKTVIYPKESEVTDKKQNEDTFQNDKKHKKDKEFHENSDTTCKGGHHRS